MLPFIRATDENEIEIESDADNTVGNENEIEIEKGDEKIHGGIAAKRRM